MQINFEITLSDEEKARLMDVFGCTDAELQGHMQRHGRAALQEYVELYVGRRVYSRGSDILEHRLSLLVEHAFAPAVPDDVRVARLFQSTLSASRTLLRNTLTKYRFELTDPMKESGKALLEAAEWAGPDDYHATTGASPILIEELNRTLRAVNPTMKGIVRTADSVGTYAINAFAYDLLAEKYGAVAVARP